MAATHTQPRRRALTSGRRERRRVETRERIYRAALDLFARHGFMETTVEAITEAADVGKGTFFNYFPTKEHVLATYGAERLAAVEEALQQAQTGEQPVMNVLRELATDVAGQATQSPALLRAIYAAHASDAAVRRELQARMKTGRQILAQIFRLAQQRGEVRPDLPASEMARLTQLIFHGVMCSWSLNPAGTLRITSAEVWDMLLTSFAAIAPQSAPGRTGG